MKKRQYTVADGESAVLVEQPEAKSQPESFKALVIYWASKNIHTTNADKLARWSGYNRDFVREVGRKLRGDGTWVKGEVNLKVRVRLKEDAEVRNGLYFAFRVEPESYSLDDLRSLHVEINDYRRDAPGSYGVWSEKRKLTSSEWRKIKKAIKEHDLLCRMVTSSFGFQLGMDLLLPSTYPGVPVEGVIAIPQDALPVRILPDDKHQQGDKEWDPRTRWDKAWDVFGALCFTDRNVERVQFSGLKMPRRKGDYEY